MNPTPDHLQALTRRHFFGRTTLGLGSAALESMLPPSAAHAATDPLGLPHFAPKAKRAIYLFMNEGPSQMDTWDYKPKMNDWFDKDLPESIRAGQRLTTLSSGQSRFPIAPSKYKIAQYGKSGMWVSELLPWTAKIDDELCLIKSVRT